MSREYPWRGSQATSKLRLSKTLGGHISLTRVVFERRNVRSGQVSDSGPGERFGSSGVEWRVTWHQEVKLENALNERISTYPRAPTRGKGTRFNPSLRKSLRETCQ